MLSIGELARRTQVKIPTIRYYEKIGLLAAPDRSQGNQRRYDKSGLERLAFIKHARDLGLSVEAIRALIEMSAHPGNSCAAADLIAKDHLVAIRDRIKALQRLEVALIEISSSCAGETIGECQVIRALADHSLCGEKH